MKPGANLTTYPSKHISISINRPADAVYSFASNPENLPQWAAGLSNSTITKKGDDWLSDSPMGEVKVSFAARNEYGILDHYVTLPSGEKVYNPLRVFSNNKGSEVVFTLYWLPGKTENELAEDAAMIARDLNRLKEILEKE
jgi:uncharacterized membrane protein